MYQQVAKPGERIQEALNDLGMRQSELCRITGINTGGMSSYITGRYEPKQDALYKMGKALGVSEMWLAGYDVPKERPQEQRQNDLLADIQERARKDPEFLSLLQKANDLTPEQVRLFSQLVDQVRGQLPK